MEKVSINLNPKAEINQHKFLQNLSQYSPFLAWGIVLLLIFIILFYLLLVFRANVYKGYQKKWKDWQARFEELEGIKKEIDQLEKEKMDLSGLSTPTLRMAQVLAELFAVLPKNIWFEDLVYRKGSLGLKGYAVRWKEDYLVSLDKFIGGLKKKEYFSSLFKRIEIRGTQRTNFNGVEVLEFNLECLK